MVLFNYPELAIAQQEEVFYAGDFIGSNELIRDCKQKISVFSNHNPHVLLRFDHLVDALQEGDANFPLSKLLNAISFAAEKHQNQTRKDKAATPYIIHPMGVALSLWEEGSVRDPVVLIAALLHDTLEDTDAMEEEITALFGNQVSSVVAQLTNPQGLSSEESKAWQVRHAPSMSQEAKLVKLADRLYNVRDLQTAPVGWDEDKIQKYYGWGQKLLNALEGTHPVLERLLQDEINHR